MTQLQQNAYTILGLRKGASEKEIKAAYVELVKRYDPEKHTERFMLIQGAYEKLRDQKKRAKEDVFTYNYARGEFSYTSEERSEEDSLPDVIGRIRQLEEQLKQDPSNPSAKPALIANYMKRSYRHTHKKLWMEAIKDWVNVLRLDSTHQRAKNNLLFSYVFLGYHYALHDLMEDAISLWEKSLQMDPNNVDVIHNLALASDKLGNEEKSKRYWTETLKRWKAQLDRNPGDEYLKTSIIEAHKHAGDKALESMPTAETKQQAVEQYKEILKINPNDFEAQFNVASSLMENKKYDEAIETLRKLQVQHPKNLDILNLLGWAHLNAGKLELAFNYWRRGISMDPKNPVIKESMMRARLAVGKKLKESGHYVQALVHFKELQKLIPNQWELHFEIGDTLMRQGDRRNALVEFQRVLDLDPKNKYARKAISEIRMRA